MTQNSVIKNVIQEIKNGSSQYYFYVLPITNKPCASVSYVYDLVKLLNDNGFVASIVHEKDYKIPNWMGIDYNNIKHIQIDKLNIRASDFLFIPELYVQNFYKDMEKAGIKLPCELIVLSQFHEFIYHSIDVGITWSDFNIRHAITTSNAQANYIKQSMRGIKVHTISPIIHSIFKKSVSPNKPFIMVMARDPKDGERIVNEFYNIYPHYRWVPFKIVNNLDRDKFAYELSECCLSIWVDPQSSFGTFPLESMKCGVPVIGLIPSMIPDWMHTKNADGDMVIIDNGIWLTSKLSIAKYIATYMDGWLTDQLPLDIENQMNNTVENYSEIAMNNQIIVTFNAIKDARISWLSMIDNKDNKK